MKFNSIVTHGRNHNEIDDYRIHTKYSKTKTKIVMMTLLQFYLKFSYYHFFTIFSEYLPTEKNSYQ